MHDSLTVGGSVSLADIRIEKKVAQRKHRDRALSHYRTVHSAVVSAQDLRGAPLCLLVTPQLVMS